MRAFYLGRNAESCNKSNFATFTKNKKGRGVPTTDSPSLGIVPERSLYSVAKDSSAALS